MTYQEYFELKSTGLGIDQSVEDITAYLTSLGYSPTSEADIKELDSIFLEYVHGLILRPDVSEGDLSIKYDRNAIMKWYAAEKLRLDGGSPLGIGKVSDASYLA